MTSHYVHLDNNTVWPVNVGEIEWRLRYSTPSREDCLVAASVLAIYTHMTDLSIRSGQAEMLLHRARQAQREADQ